MNTTSLESIKEKHKEYQMKDRYGLSAQEYENLRILPEGKCKICGVRIIEKSAQRNGRERDHDHKTGKIRLCRHCNSAIGNS